MPVARFALGALSTVALVLAAGGAVDALRQRTKPA